MTSPSLNRNRLKYLAILAMMLDHTAMFLLSEGLEQAPVGRIALYSGLRVIGRLAGPLMLFFLTEGFIHTSDRRKYGLRLLVFGLLSQVPYALAHYGKLLVLDFNVILTLFMCLVMLTAAEKISRPLLNRITVFAIIIGTFCFDWGVIGPFMVWLFYQSRDSRKAQIRAYCIICAIQVVSAAVFLARNGHHWYGELWQAGMFLVVPALLWYNGEPGSRSAVNKWIFYIIYPLHLLVFWIIKYVV